MSRFLRTGRAASSLVRRSRVRRLGTVESLERREVLSTFTVSNLDASGPGSLRWAIQSSNANPGADVVEFSIPGTIRVGRRSLPAITDAVRIDGTSAPSYAGAPVVTVDFQGTRGLSFNGRSDGSILNGLSLVRSGTAGVTLNASRITLQGNYIGLLADGSTVAANRGDGVRINATSHDDVIGRVDPASSVSYYNADSVALQPVSGWQGIREGAASGEYLIAGTSSTQGLLYVGPITGAGGTSYFVNYPGAASTSVYGPDLLANGSIRLVGSYRTGSDEVAGFVYEGTTADLGNGSNYRTIAYPGAQYNYVHSTMGGLAVGNADGPEGNLPIGAGHAFLYDLASNAFLPNVVYPGSTSTTAYGIWRNGPTSYTIAGGYSTLGDSQVTVGRGYLVDYDSATGVYSNWTSFDYPSGVPGVDLITHFEGISSVEKGVYTLSADAVSIGSGDPGQGAWASVRRQADGSFGPAVWVPLEHPGVPAAGGIVSSNSVVGDQVVGIVIGDSGGFSYQATINTGFQLSNVISGNAGDGISIRGARGVRIAMNHIGTDASGRFARGNCGHGVRLTAGATANMVGGQASNGNDPTAGVFARPSQGNLISGNRGNGVLIEKGSTRNMLSGNFIGTDAAGNGPIGNRLDGVAINGANSNALIGCTVQEDPFVFYNVISGNGGHGVRVTNSHDVTIHANFIGVGADNASIVANRGNGLLVSGTSRNTQVGGVIPLGNVISGNDRNGIEVRDRASGFVSFNTFGGVFAFGAAAPNGRSGILITSTGGDNLIRTSIISGNRGHGIELNGGATGVQITDTATGTNTNLEEAVPNGGDGVRIAGRAHHNAIGGFQPSIEPTNTLSANRGYGVAILGSAHDNYVFHSKIGTTGSAAAKPLGNSLGGVFLGAGTRSNVIGGAADPALGNDISDNGGDGVTIQSSRAARIAGNSIRLNLGYGVRATGASGGSVIIANAFDSNTQGNVDLAGSRGVVYIP